MKNIEFQFSVIIQGEPKTININLPFEDGLVYGGMFCPYRLTPHTVTEKPFHWYRAEDFMAICDTQINLASQIPISTHVADIPSQCIILAIKNVIKKLGIITFSRLISELDCFSAIQYSLYDERDPLKVKKYYHSLAMYLIDCFPKQCVYGNPPIAIKESRIYQDMIRLS